MKKEGLTETLNVKTILLSLLMLLLPPGKLFLFYFMKDTDTGSFLTGFITLGMLLLVFVFVFLTGLYQKTFLYNNGAHPERLLGVYVLGLLLVAVNSFLPCQLWLFLPLAVMLMLASGPQTGIGAYLILLYLQELISQPDPVVFVSFALIGMMGMVLFSHLDTTFLFGVPLFTALLFTCLALLCMDFAQQGTITFENVLYTAINLFVSFIILTLVLKYLSLHILHKNRDKYQEMNDPEYVLLTDLKQYSKKAYYHAVHTAYFCEKIARKIGADEMLAKAGGYYHKIGRMRGEGNLKNALAIAREYHFPPELVQLLKEYGGKNTSLVSREAAIVLLADAMVSSVMFLFEKNPRAELNYEQIAGVVFKKQIESGILDHCSLTISQLNEIHKIFVEETLYYDFLR